MQPAPARHLWDVWFESLRDRSSLKQQEGGMLTQVSGRTPVLTQVPIITRTHNHHFEIKVKLPSLCAKCHRGAKACASTEKSMHWPAVASRDPPGICRTP